VMIGLNTNKGRLNTIDGGSMTRYSL